MSSFEQTIMCWSPRCHRNRSTSSGEEDFVGFLTIYWRSSHLGYVTSIMFMDFHFLVPEPYIQNLVKTGPVVSKKNKFQFSYVNALGPRSRNDLEPLYLHYLNKLSAPVPEKIFEGLLPNIGHLGHVTSIMFMNFHFLVP